MRREKCDRHGLNDIVAKTPIFQRFYEKCSLVVRRVQLRSPFPKIIQNLDVFGCEQVFRRVFRIRQGTRAAQYFTV